MNKGVKLPPTTDMVCMVLSHMACGEPQLAVKNTRRNTAVYSRPSANALQHVQSLASLGQKLARQCGGW